MRGEELGQTGDGPFDTWTLPSRVEKYFDSKPSNTHVESVLTSFTQRAPGHRTAKKKRSPCSRSIRVCLGARHRWAWGWASPWWHCYLGGAPLPLYQLLKTEFGPFGQAPPNSSEKWACSTAWALFWQPPAQSCFRTVLHLVSKAVQQKVASVLRRWKLSIHLFFTVTCSGPHFTKYLVSFIIVSGKESSIKIVLVWIENSFIN